VKIELWDVRRLTFLGYLPYKKIREGHFPGVTIMQGILIFNSLAEAVASGFEYLDRTEGGYLVRKRTQNGWALALAKEKRVAA
jgi:hypothetical protein